MTGHLHHVGISTPDLDRAVNFYQRMFGFTVLARGGWQAGNEVRDRQHLTRDSAAHSAILKRDGMLLELRQYLHPVGKPKAVDQPVVDHGINHFCIHVDDVQAEYERLTALGMTFHAAPEPVAPGLVLTYGRDPDGNVIELLQGDIEVLATPEA